MKRAIEARIGERRGRPSAEEIPGKFPEIPQGVETAVYAADKAGLGDRKTAAAAETVVDTATPELREVGGQSRTAKKGGDGATDRPMASGGSEANSGVG